MKIIFFGTPNFAIPVLSTLLDNHYDVVGVFAGRGPMKLKAKKQNIKVFTPQFLKDEEIFKIFKNLKPDLCIIAAYGKIIPSRYLKIPKWGFVNIHPSLLPKYRGPSPVQTAILNGDTETGASLMLVDNGVDHGPLLARTKYIIPSTKHHLDITKEIFKLGAELLVKILPKYVSEEIKPVPQNHSQATFTKKFERKDGRIDWNESEEKIYNQIRALNPEPGTWSVWNDKVIKIFDITTRGVVMSINYEKKPGTVVKVGNDVAVVIKTCYLILNKIQLEGGKEMDAKSFVNGHPDFLNSTLE